MENGGGGGMKWRMVQRDGVGVGGNIYKSNKYITCLYVKIYVLSLPFFILALFSASRGGWKLAARYCWMLLSGGKVRYLCMGRVTYFR